MRRLWRFADDHALGLPIGALAALVWANALPVSYFQTSRALEFAVNDVGMALVVAFLAQETLEAVLPGGSLDTWRRAAFPIVAAVGGIAGATLTYTAYVFAGDEQMLAAGWPAACAVDVLLAFAVARSIFGRGAPATFVLVLSIVSNVAGLGFIVVRSGFATTSPAAALLLAVSVGIAVALRRLGRRSVWSYVALCGIPSWFACRLAGVPAALALLPILPFMPRSPRDLASGNADPGTHDSTTHLERALGPSVQAIAFLFGLVNAGVRPEGFEPGAWALITAAIVGRPVGVLAGATLAHLSGLRLPLLVGWREMVVIAASAGPSLAFGVFLSMAAFPVGPLLTEMKIGAIASGVGVLPVFAAARALGVGRFAWC